MLVKVVWTPLISPCWPRLLKRSTAVEPALRSRAPKLRVEVFTPVPPATLKTLLRPCARVRLPSVSEDAVWARPWKVMLPPFIVMAPDFTRSLWSKRLLLLIVRLA